MRAFDLGEDADPAVFRGDVERMVDACRAERSVAIGRPPSRVTASATALPIAPAAPVISTILSWRRGMRDAAFLRPARVVS